jgi:hypothetical protein
VRQQDERPFDEEGTSPALGRNRAVHAGELGAALRRRDQQELRRFAKAMPSLFALLMLVVVALTTFFLHSHLRLSLRGVSPL